MELPPLIDGFIRKRYKRFLADVELGDGRVVTAHCPNTGRMTGCWAPGAAVQMSYSDNPRRRLSWTLERVDMGQGWIGVNTQRVNAVVAEGILAGRVPSLAGYDGLRREVAREHGSARSRLDLLLEGGQQPAAYIEVKNVTLLDGDLLKFPDARTERGRKHLQVLQQLVESGKRGIMVYALNRPEGRGFAPAESVDPEYADELARVATAGVEILAVRLQHTATGIVLTGSVPVCSVGSQ